MSASLSFAPNFVRDAFVLSAVVPYKPEDVRLGEYTFLPWVRTGMAAIVEAPAASAIRATVSVSVDVQDDKGGIHPVAKTLTLRGPGDILGIDPTQIVRRYPTPNAFDAEATFLAHVEFDRPELPWLFTPFAARGGNLEQLDPWLALVVLDINRASFEPAAPGLPARVRTHKGELQPLDESWAFAHAQVIGDAAGQANVGVRAGGAPIVGSDAGSPKLSDRLTDEYGAVNLSRLLCPRRLEEGKEYVACVVPAYECGVNAGLGIGGGTLARAWERSAGDDDEEIVLPVYDYWRFATAAGGDFEELARRLVPVSAPWRVGRRIIDISNPRGGLAPLAAADPGRTQILKCALYSAASAPADAPPEDGGWSPAKREELRAALNRPDQVSADSAVPAADLPRVGPKIYARFQRGVGRVAGVGDADWFEQLNTTPVHRIVAGLGTRVVQKDQEPLMQAAWAQVGAIEKANQALIRMQYSRYLAAAMHEQHLSRLSLGTLSQVSRAVHGKVRLGGSAFTVAGDFRRSFVAPAAVGLTFRRAVAGRTFITKKLAAAAASVVGGIAASGAGFRDFRRRVAEPDGVRNLSETAIKTMAPDVIGRALGVAAGVAADTLRQRVGAGRNVASVADRMVAPVATWNVAAGAINPGRVGAQRLTEVLRIALPAQPADDPARSEALGTLFNGVAASGIDEVAAPAREVVRSIGAALPAVAIAPPRAAPGLLVAGPIVMAPAAGRRVGAPAAAGAATRSTGAVVLSAAGVAAAGPAANFVPKRLESAGSVAIGTALAGAREMSRLDFAKGLADATGNIGVAALPLPPERPAPTVNTNTLLTAINPAQTLTRYAKGRLGILPSWLAADWFDDGVLRPIMAAPKFDRPMYEALDAYDRDWLVPGLGAIDKTDFVTLLETNPAFTEAFLIGLSDEMGRELLWRGYPTDQRGTYFEHFWGEGSDELSEPIHRFRRLPLGAHVSDGASGHVVLVVRGALVKRYPNAIMMALRETSPRTSPPTFDDPSQPGASARILFHAHLAPDILLVGFDLTVQRVKDERWWFIIAEHPTAPRFGLDVEDNQPAPVPEPPPPLRKNRNGLDWDDVSRTPDGRFMRTVGREIRIDEASADPPPLEISWPPATSAVVARALLQNPVRAAYDGAKLLTPIS